MCYNTILLDCIRQKLRECGDSSSRPPRVGGFPQNGIVTTNNKIMSSELSSNSQEESSKGYANYPVKIHHPQSDFQAE